jgi:putative membrane protein
MHSNEEQGNERSHVDTPDPHITTSKKVTDHLANERTFLAWVRTGIATITFGFVIARFGYYLRQIEPKTPVPPLPPFPFSQIVGIVLTLLGISILLIALRNFLTVRQSIDSERFYPVKGFPILLAAITSVIGLVLALYLWLS